MLAKGHLFRTLLVFRSHKGSNVSLFPTPQLARWTTDEHVHCLPGSHCALLPKYPRWRKGKSSAPISIRILRKGKSATPRILKVAPCGEASRCQSRTSSVVSGVVAIGVSSKHYQDAHAEGHARPPRLLCHLPVTPLNPAYSFPGDCAQHHIHRRRPPPPRRRKVRLGTSFAP